MDHFIDITLLPDPEFKATVLMNAVYSKLHKKLCEHHSTDIGVSFPDYKLTLGNILRIHGSDKGLGVLLRTGWLGGMIGYCKVGEVSPIPETADHRTVRRKQTTMSEAKLKRLLKRGSIKQDDTGQYRTKMSASGLDNPYLELVSGSNGQKHRRYIQFGDLTEKPIEGEFDSFGLSKTATVPWF